ncbi:GNAT family N-acetyltransferase [Rhizobium sp. KVB221]|uniref:GNAT family N-acetyltransferase n=1 Tax=Rhizobium setariae TaxID=2801340 RepID=A0A937CPB3_9HYPH|nr:GNAT family N-acetyltransferase [Rhizobium setariae]MBL0372263.1 GNAT family N-acetyltransferase [Rhizobium setariae]
MNALNHKFDLPQQVRMPAFDADPTTARLTAANQPLIRTGRLTLRRPAAGDAEAIAAALGNHRVARMLLPVPQPYYREDAEEWLAALNADGQPGWVFAITLGGLRRILLSGQPPKAADDDRLVGVVGIDWQRRHGQEGWQIGYWLDEPHWGQGIMTEAVNAVIARFFHGLMGEVLFSSVIAENAASLRIQKKLGFDITGVEDVYCVPRAEQVRLITTELTFGSYMPM